MGQCELTLLTLDAQINDKIIAKHGARHEFDNWMSCKVQIVSEEKNVYDYFHSIQM